MRLRYFSLIVGIIYLLLGITGFIPALVTPPTAAAPSLVVDTGYGYAMGLFPVNILHNIVHLGVGVWGIASYKSEDSARTYARAMAILYAVLAFMGVFPVLYTTFGFIPIFGNNVWFNALTAVSAAYFGFVVPTLKEAGTVR